MSCSTAKESRRLRKGPFGKVFSQLSQWMSKPQNLAIAGAVSFAVLAMPINYFRWLGFVVKTVRFVWWLGSGSVWFFLYTLMYAPFRYLLTNGLTWPLGLVTYVVLYSIDYLIQTALRRLLWIFSFGIFGGGSKFGRITQATEATCDAVHILIWPLILAILGGGIYLALILYRWETDLQAALVKGDIYGARGNKKDAEDEDRVAFVAMIIRSHPTSADAIKERLADAEKLHGQLSALISPLDEEEVCDHPPLTRAFQIPMQIQPTVLPPPPWPGLRLPMEMG
jgi:hypothetical protein